MFAEQQQVERAVFLIGLKQAVKAQERCQQGADPEDGRADAREQIEIRPHGKGKDGDDDEEEQHAHQRATADADGQFQIPNEEGTHS